MRQQCQIPGCSVDISGHLFACRPHWQLIPPALQRQIRGTYTRGQEHGSGSVTPTYLDAVHQAKRFVASLEARGRRT